MTTNAPSPVERYSELSSLTEPAQPLKTASPLPDEAKAPAASGERFFSVDSRLLARQLKALLPFISNNPIVPILDNVLLTVGGDELLMQVGDLQSFLTLETPITRPDGAEYFTCCVPAKRFYKLITALPEQDLRIEFNAETNKVFVVAHTGQYKFYSDDPMDYPKVPLLQSQVGPLGNVVPAKFTMHSEVLRGLLTKTLAFCTNDDLRPAMTGIFIKSNFTGAEVVSTDGHRLIRIETATFTTEQDLQFILPQKTGRALLKVLPIDQYGEDIQVEVSHVNARFSWRGNELVCRIIDERFPDYNSAIPTANPLSALVDRRALLAMLNRVIQFANATTHQIAISFDGTVMTLDAEDRDWDMACSESLPAPALIDPNDVSGLGDMGCKLPFVIGMNAKLFIQTLKQIKTQKIQLCMSVPNRAFIMHPVEDGEIDTNISILQMPVMINQYD